MTSVWNLPLKHSELISVCVEFIVISSFTPMVMVSIEPDAHSVLNQMTSSGNTKEFSGWLNECTLCKFCLATISVIVIVTGSPVEEFILSQDPNDPFSRVLHHICIVSLLLLIEKWLRCFWKPNVNISVNIKLNILGIYLIPSHSIRWTSE